MEILDRLKEVIADSKLSDRAFAMKCGIKQPTLDKQIKGLRAVSLDVVMAILDAFPNISAEWMMRGEGQMYKSEEPTTPAPDANFDRIMKLVDTIATLQDALNTEKKTCALYKERIAQLENQLKK